MFPSELSYRICEDLKQITLVVSRVGPRSPCPALASYAHACMRAEINVSSSACRQ